MTNRFFITKTCERCHAGLEGQARKMSWFTEECLCEDCIKKEQEARNKMDAAGIDSSSLEGCGYLPKMLKE